MPQKDKDVQERKDKDVQERIDKDDVDGMDRKDRVTVRCGLLREQLTNNYTVAHR